MIRASVMSSQYYHRCRRLTRTDARRKLFRLDLKPIDLLPDRSVETVSAWLQARPSIDIVSLDGSSDYAKDWSFANFPAYLDVFLVESMAEVVEASIGKIRRGETGISVFLHGSTGAGKTSVAVSALRRYMEEGYAGCFLPVRRYIRLLQSGFRKDASPELARLEDLIVSVPTRRSGGSPRVTTLSAPMLFGTSSKTVGALASRSASKNRI